MEYHHIRKLMVAALVAVSAFLLVPFDAALAADEDLAGEAESARIARIPAPTTVSAEAKERLSRPVSWPDAETRARTAEEWIPIFKSYDEATTKRVSDLIKRLPVSVEQSMLNGVTIWTITPDAVPQQKKDKLLLGFHGGAYVINAGKAGLGRALHLAVESGYTTIMVDYRMPPEHPFPAAVDDGVAVYEGVLERLPPHRIALFGTSTGGALAAATTLAARDRGLPLPAAIVMDTPWSDLDKVGDSYKTLEGADVSLVTYEGLLRVAADLYADGEDKKNPLLSPVYADFSKGFPPSLLISGTRDLFLSNTVRLHRALRDAGHFSDLLVFEGMWHAFMDVPEADVARVEMISFVDEQLLAGMEAQ